MRGRNSVHLII